MEDAARALVPRAGQESQLEALRDENKITCLSFDVYSDMSFHELSTRPMQDNGHPKMSQIIPTCADGEAQV